MEINTGINTFEIIDEMFLHSGLFTPKSVPVFLIELRSVTNTSSFSRTTVRWINSTDSNERSLIIVHTHVSPIKIKL